MSGAEKDVWGVANVRSFIRGVWAGFESTSVRRLRDKVLSLDSHPTLGCVSPTTAAASRSYDLSGTYHSVVAAASDCQVICSQKRRRVAAVFCVDCMG